MTISRRKFLRALASALALVGTGTFAQKDGPGRRGGQGGRRKRTGSDYALPADLVEFALLSLVLGRVSDRSVTVSALAKQPLEGYFEYGTAPGKDAHRTATLLFPVGEPVETVFDGLPPNTECFYQLHYRKPGEPAFGVRP